MRITKKFIEDCVNNALGTKVNELRLIALDKNKTITQKIALSEIASITQTIAAGQSGHNEHGKYVVPAPIKPKILRQTILEQTKLWKGMTHVDGEHVVFTVPVPTRQILKK